MTKKKIHQQEQRQEQIAASASASASSAVVVVEMSDDDDDVDHDDNKDYNDDDDDDIVDDDHVDVRNHGRRQQHDDDDDDNDDDDDDEQEDDDDDEDGDDVYETRGEKNNNNDADAEEAGGYHDDEAQLSSIPPPRHREPEPQQQQEDQEHEACTFDIRNLLAMNYHQLNSTVLYNNNDNKNNKQHGTSSVATITSTANTSTIMLLATRTTTNEDYLLSKAMDGCSQLIECMWSRRRNQSGNDDDDVDKKNISDDMDDNNNHKKLLSASGYIITLPSNDDSRIPRSLPLPPPKVDTKWEKYAKERGIPLNKKKRSQKVWDDVEQTWKYRHGYNRAAVAGGEGTMASENKANGMDKWPIIEVKNGQDPYEDPWERLRDAKRIRVEKNMEGRMRNQERAGFIPKGTTTRTMKNIQQTRQIGKMMGGASSNAKNNNINNKNGKTTPPPAGVPVDLQPSRIDKKDNSNNNNNDYNNNSKKDKQRGQESTMKALMATQRSTASLGKFDKMRQGEPDRKLNNNKTLSKKEKGSDYNNNNKKRKHESTSNSNPSITETDHSIKIFRTMMKHGGMEREIARKKGNLATGETPYDYEYNDNNGPSSFRKKKGRAGIGKLKKMTKKRVK